MIKYYVFIIKTYLFLFSLDLRALCIQHNVPLPKGLAGGEGNQPVVRDDMPQPGLAPARFLNRFRQKLAERERRHLMNRRLLIPRFLVRPRPSVMDIANSQLSPAESDDAENEEEAPFNFGDN